ncbi:MAG: NUDIX domain-containing protein [Patescibacteria group bacterium]
MNQTSSENSRKQIVAIVLYKDGKVLAGVRKADRALDAGKCVFPGGHVQNGENLETAIKREMLEELGIKLINPKLIYSTDFDTKGELQTINFFGCTEFEGDPIPLEDAQHIWIDPKTESHLFSYDLSRTVLAKFLLDAGK